ncbi:hypothetical protein BDZ91DRAFT_554128 [Kalaharituber pfeilii]|nr:hypothetical protein BDZ91DRAFT_554128 [Kalaharituber pfeilii]
MKLATHMTLCCTSSGHKGFDSSGGNMPGGWMIPPASNINVLILTTCGLVSQRRRVTSGKQHSLGVRHLFSKVRSKSPRPRQAGRATSPTPPLSIPGLNSDDLSLLENPKVLANPQLLLGLNEEIASLSRIARNAQQSVPTYHKLRWASTDKTKCNELVGQLKEYIDDLFDVLPLDATLSTMPQARSLHLSFNIPFSLPDVRRNSDFVGREDVLGQIKRKIKIEEGGIWLEEKGTRGRPSRNPYDGQ